MLFPLGCTASNQYDSNKAEITIDSTLEVEPWFTVDVNDSNSINFTSQVKAVTQNCSVANESDYVYAGKSPTISFSSNIPDPKYSIECGESTMSNTSNTITAHRFLCIENKAVPLTLNRKKKVPQQGTEVLLLIHKRDIPNQSSVYKGMLTCNVSVDY